MGPLCTPSEFSSPSSCGGFQYVYFVVISNKVLKSKWSHIQCTLYSRFWHSFTGQIFYQKILLRCNVQLKLMGKNLKSSKQTFFLSQYITFPKKKKNSEFFFQQGCIYIFYYSSKEWIDSNERVGKKTLGKKSLTF